MYSYCIKGSFKFLHPGQNNRYLNLKKGFLSVLRFKSSDFFVLKFLPKRKKEKKVYFMWSNAYFLPPQGMYFPVSIYAHQNMCNSLSLLKKNEIKFCTKFKKCSNI